MTTERSVVIFLVKVLVIYRVRLISAFVFAFFREVIKVLTAELTF